MFKVPQKHDGISTERASFSRRIGTMKSHVTLPSKAMCTLKQHIEFRTSLYYFLQIQGHHHEYWLYNFQSPWSQI